MTFNTARVGCGALLGLIVAACGGGGGGGTTVVTPPPVANVMTASVDQGPIPATQIEANVLYVTITVCAPGSTTNCQDVDHVQVDTGSWGLRLVGEALNSSLLNALTATTAVTKIAGNTVYSCAAFGDGYSWGALTTADVQLIKGGAHANALPIHIIQDPTNVALGLPAVPSGCSTNSGNPNNPESTIAQMGAKGILGVGVFLQDCGQGCAQAPPVGQTIPEAFYYTCPGGTCAAALVPIAQQLQNPASMVNTVDRNGIAIKLPLVSSTGATSVSGSLFLGVGTQSNNGLGSAQIVPVDPAWGYIYTTYGGTGLANSVVDSGSNGYFFNDLGIAQCASPYTFWYCPTGNLPGLQGTIQGEMETVAGQTATAPSILSPFTIGNAQTMFNTSGSAFPNLGGTGTTGSFDWGLPFFFGKTVFVVFENQMATGSTATGPYLAF